MNQELLANIPVIDCEDFLLRPVKLEDYKDMYEYGSDPETVKYITWGPYKNIEEAKSSVENFFLNRPENGVPYAHAIVWKENNKMIGTCDFASFSLPHKRGEIGYCINKKYWGKGIATRATQELIKLGFEYFKLNRIQIKHLSDNVGSKRVIEKCGFKFECLQKQVAILKGKTVDLPVYSIIKEDYYNKTLPWQKELTDLELSINDITVKHLQKYIKTIDHHPEWKLEVMLKLLEEVAELSIEMRKESISGYDEKRLTNIKYELYDVIHFVCHIANIYDIDLEEAIREKDKINKSRYSR